METTNSNRFFNQLPQLPSGHEIWRAGTPQLQMGFPIDPSDPSSFIEDVSFDYRKLQFIHLFHHISSQRTQENWKNHWWSVEHRDNPTYNRLATGMSLWAMSRSTRSIQNQQNLKLLAAANPADASACQAKMQQCIKVNRHENRGKPNAINHVYIHLFVSAP